MDKSSLWRTLLLCVLITGAAWAQSEIGGATLGGSVTDPAGAFVAGAKITLSSEATGVTRQVESSAAGLFNFVRVPVGRYALSVEKTGFKTARRPDIDLAVGAVLNLDVHLEIGQTQESVTVTAEVPVIETTRSQTSTNVNEKSVRDLPINGRNFLDFTLLTPGVNRDPRTGDLSFGGQRGTANSLLVDGIDSNNLFFGQSAGRAGGGRNPYSFSQDAVQEFQVNTNGYAPEAGRAGGGVVNVVTKSGTNQMHGSAFWFYRDRYLNANTTLNNARGIVRQPYHFNQLGGTLGGPVKKDRIFYFLAHDAQRNTNPNPVFFPASVPSDAASQQAARDLAQYLTPYTTGSNNDIGLAKVDWNLSDNDRLSVRWNVHRFRGENFENSGPRSARERTGNSNVSTDHLMANYTKVFGGAVVWDARFNWLRDDLPGFANSDKPEAQIFQNNVLWLAIGRNNFSPRFTKSNRWQTVQTVSYLRGKHSYKIGGDLNFERIENFFPGNFSGSFSFNSLADFAAKRAFQLTQAFAGQGTSGPLTKPNINETAFFVQDTWRVRERLTVTYGYRYDVMRYAANNVPNPNAGLAAGNLRTDAMPSDNNNHAARLGVAWRLDEAGRSLIRMGGGVFYARVPSILIGTAHSQNGIQVQTYTIRENVPAYPNVLSAPPAASRTPDIFVMASNFRQPMSYQWNFNYEAQPLKDIAVTVGYLGVKGTDLSRTRDINLYPAAMEAVRWIDGSYTGISAHPRTRPNTSFGRISLFDSGAMSIYHGGFVQVQKRFAKNFQLQASYTLSKVIDTLPDGTSVVVGTGDDAKVAQDTLYPNLDRAVGSTDIKRNFIGSGVWDLNLAPSSAPYGARLLLNGWQLAGIFNGRSGFPFSATVGGNSDLNNDANARTDRPPFLGRNTYRLPSFYSLDARVSKTIPLGMERLRIRLIGEAFNLANRANYSAMNTSPVSFNSTTRAFTSVATFNTPNNVFDPRILQLALRVEF